MLFPIGIQNFEKIRKGGYVYVDKTALLYEMANSGSYYFLSRPRRFGKSLLLSTLEAYFLGQKDLFKGLAIEQLEKDWTVYPVLHIDMTAREYDTPQSLYGKLDDKLKVWEKQYKVEDIKDEPGPRFDRWFIKPISRRAIRWSFWLTSTTSRCWPPSATRNCKRNTATFCKVSTASSSRVMPISVSPF
jgi:hypothetical protein